MNNNDLNYNQQDNFNMSSQIPNNDANTNYTSNDLNTNNKNNKTILIIIGVVAVIIILFIFGGKSKSGKNTTGSSEYNSSDVDFSCSYVSKGDDFTITTYSDFIFNYKSSQYTYQLKQYNKMILGFKNTITDEKYKEFIDDLNSLDCLDAGSCTESHLEFSTTKYGWDTVVDRSSNKIELTFYNLNGKGITATKDDINSTRASFESKGYTCN